MEHGAVVCQSLNQVKCSLDELQKIVQAGHSSDDSLKRLRQALSDINEEVDMLKNVIEFDGK